MKKSISLFLFITLSITLVAQNYVIDKSFGENGVIKYSFADSANLNIAFNGYNLGDSYLIQSFTEPEEEDGYFSFAKFSKTGELDTTYADNGELKIYSINSDEPVIATILPDKRLVFPRLKEDLSFSIDIYNNDGILEDSFPVSFGDYDVYTTTIASDDNYIYVGGIFDFNDISKSFIIKTDFKGNFDSSFGDNGIYIFQNDSIGIELNTFILQEGNIIVATNQNYPNTFSNDSLFITKLNSKGEVVSDFGDNGYIKMENEFEDYLSLLPDKNQNIYVVSFGIPIMFKFDKNGKIDTTFGNSGIAYYGSLGIEDLNIFFPKLLNDESIILFCASSEDIEESQTTLLKIDTNGKIDSTFGNYGVKIDYFGGYSAFINGIVEDDGSFLALGTQGIEDAEQNSLIVKYKPESSATGDFYKQDFDIKIYPNPITNNDLIIDFDLEQKSNIEIDIFDMIGNKILNLYQGPGSTGKNSINSHLPFALNQGIYLIRLKTTQGISTKKITVAY